MTAQHYPACGIRNIEPDRTPARSQRRYWTRTEFDDEWACGPNGKPFRRSRKVAELKKGGLYGALP